jgi:Holliday junction resolvase-like predicted endonuclease
MILIIIPRNRIKTKKVTEKAELWLAQMREESDTDLSIIVINVFVKKKRIRIYIFKSENLEKYNIKSKN